MTYNCIYFLIHSANLCLSMYLEYSLFSVIVAILSLRSYLFVFCCSWFCLCVGFVFWTLLWVTWLFFGIPSWYIPSCHFGVYLCSYLSGFFGYYSMHMWLPTVDRYYFTILNEVWKPFFHFGSFALPTFKSI